MSRGNNLQEMEVGTKQSRTAVNAGAKAAEPMGKLAPGAVDGQTGSWEDLGGPTPDNYRPDDSSAELKDPATGLKSVSNVVNNKAKAADSMKSLKKSDAVKEEVEEIDEEIDEEEEYDEEIETEGEDEEDLVTEASKKEDDEDEDEEEDEDEDEDEEKSKTQKEEYDIEEDMNALLNTGDEEELSEEFKDKARIIFESALRSKVSEIKESH